MLTRMMGTDGHVDGRTEGQTDGCDNNSSAAEAEG